MTALTVALSDETASKVNEIARDRGISPEVLLETAAIAMVQDFDRHREFLALAERGKGEVDKALELLKSRE